MNPSKLKPSKNNKHHSTAVKNTDKTDEQNKNIENFTTIFISNK